MARTAPRHMWSEPTEDDDDLSDPFDFDTSTLNMPDRERGNDTRSYDHPGPRSVNPSSRHRDIGYSSRSEVPATTRRAKVFEVEQIAPSWKWPDELDFDIGTAAKKPSPATQRPPTTAQRKRSSAEQKAGPHVGQKRSSAVQSYGRAEAPSKRMRADDSNAKPVIDTLPTSRNHHVPTTAQRAPYAEDVDVKPIADGPQTLHDRQYPHGVSRQADHGRKPSLVRSSAKKIQGPFIEIDSDSDDDDRRAPSPTPQRASITKQSVKHLSVNPDIVGDPKEVQRLASERLRREALEKKFGRSPSHGQQSSSVQPRGPRDDAPRVSNGRAEGVTVATTEPIDISSDSGVEDAWPPKSPTSLRKPNSPAATAAADRQDVDAELERQTRVRLENSKGRYDKMQAQMQAIKEAAERAEKQAAVDRARRERQEEEEVERKAAEAKRQEEAVRAEAEMKAVEAKRQEEAIRLEAERNVRLRQERAEKKEKSQKAYQKFLDDQRLEREKKKKEQFARRMEPPGVPQASKAQSSRQADEGTPASPASLNSAAVMQKPQALKDTPTHDAQPVRPSGPMSLNSLAGQAALAHSEIKPASASMSAAKAVSSRTADTHTASISGSISLESNNNRQPTFQDADHRKKLGEVLPEDVKLVKWRDMGSSWEEIVDAFEEFSGRRRGEDTLRGRYRVVSSALKSAHVPRQVQDAAGNRDNAACEQLNRAIHGTWPVQSVTDSSPSKSNPSRIKSGPDLLKQVGEILPEDIAVAKLREAGAEWQTVNAEYLSLTGKQTSITTLRRRLQMVTAALENRNDISQDVLDRLGEGRDEARAEVNRAVHGRWPLSRLMNGLGSSLEKGSRKEAPRLKTQPPRPLEDGQTLAVKKPLALPLGKGQQRMAEQHNASIGPPQAINGAEDDSSTSRSRLWSDQPDDYTIPTSPDLDEPCETHPTTSGKKLTQATHDYYLGLVAVQYTTDAEEKQLREQSPDRPEDSYHYVYFVLRREMKTDQMGEDGDEIELGDIPWTQCKTEYFTLTEANTAASNKVYRAEDRELNDALYNASNLNLETSTDDAGLKYFLHTFPAGKIEVTVERRLHTARDGMRPPSKDSWLSRTCYYIFERRTITTSSTTSSPLAEDNIFGEHQQTVTTTNTTTNETMVDNTTYTTLELANAFAMEYFLSQTFTSASMNLNRRDKEKQERRKDWKEQMEAAGDDAQFVAEGELPGGRGSIEVSVVKGTVKGARNVMV